MTELPAAGWFPDPSGLPGLLRYWDGARWTDHVHQQAPPSQQALTRPHPSTPDGQPLAGWWHRVGATGLDGLFVSIVGVLVTLPAQISLQRRLDDLNQELNRRIGAGDGKVLSWYFHQMLDAYQGRAWIFLVPGLLAIVAHTTFLHLAGGTPGQLVTGLRTRLRDKPGPLSWGRSVARVMAYSGLAAVLQALALATGSWGVLVVVLLLAIVWSALNLLWAAWDSRRQTLHDKLVGTNVVRVRR